MHENVTLDFVIPEILHGERLDYALTKLCPEYSRATLKAWIVDGSCTLNEIKVKPKTKVATDDKVKINAVVTSKNDSFTAQNIALDIAYIDGDVIVVNKPAGIVTHPAAGNWDSTLVNALLYHYPELNKLARAGIVHRLDKDTSGLLIVARNLVSYNFLVKLLQSKQITREYQAIAHGNFIAGGRFDFPIARHPKNRLKMAVVETGKNAVTHYKIINNYPKYSHLVLQLETGRTHQIRVHLSHMQHPILGDKLYSKYHNLGIARQMLHAAKLEFTHPSTGKSITVESALPPDFMQALDKIKSK